LVTLFTQPAIPDRVMAALVFLFVRPAVELDDQPEFDTEEIHDIVPDGDLPPEFQTLEPRIAQGTPKNSSAFVISRRKLRANAVFDFETRAGMKSPHPTRP